MWTRGKERNSYFRGILKLFFIVIKLLFSFEKQSNSKEIEILFFFPDNLL